ncbi:hypothetical protein [Terriglobus roseus]|uniref:Intracellular septation protein A n=1 Tax=Terriglobus roseus TaxID=392734 RepID=A0A1G7JMT6_9BACT|nr:hypothetical protein [Terriglobus roseus]SDF26094.1 hypothetical protein SAMN05444167_1876 [Terriglobus roseus]
MGILLGLSPFIAFAVLSRFTSAAVALWAAAAVSVVLILRELKLGRSLKVLDCGTLILFAGLACYTTLVHRTWDIMGVRAVVDTGLFLIMLISLIIKLPFTLQYAREEVPESLHTSPIFIRTNYILTAVWTVAMATVAAFDMLAHSNPDYSTLSRRMIIVSLVAAFSFTKWYPDHVSKAHA